MPVSQRYLIVDGHSVIFAWDDLRSLHTRRMAAAREELIRRLTAYQDFSGVQVVAVFDGQGGKVSEETVPGGIQVFYSRSGQTADSVIERLVAKYGTTYDITVATSDHAEQQTTITFGGNFITTEGLRDLLGQVEKDVARELKKRRKK